MLLPLLQFYFIKYNNRCLFVGLVALVHFITSSCKSNEKYIQTGSEIARNREAFITPFVVLIVCSLVMKNGGTKSDEIQLEGLENCLMRAAAASTKSEELRVRYCVDFQAISVKNSSD